MVDIDGYNVLRCDRSTKVGGGVMLYCQENLPITNVHIFDDKICQTLLCSCAISKSVFCIVYRPPDCTEQSFKLCLSFIDNYLDSVSDEFELNILGDFNCPRVIWSSYTILPGGSDAEQKCCKLFFDFISDHLCRQLGTEPTRQGITLDLYLSNSEELVTHVSCSSTPLSDHEFVERYWSYIPCNLITSSPPDFLLSTFRSLDFQKADYTQLNVMISSVSWNDLLDPSGDIDEFVELFTLTVLQICEICCPKRLL